MSDRESVKIIEGTHEFEFVAPDLLRFRLRGAMTDDETIKYLDFVFAHTPDENRSLYVVYDLSEMVRLDERSRKRVTEVDRPYPFDGLVVIGASYSMRMLAEMLIRAIKLIKPEYWNFPHKFVGTMAEAEAWIDEIRQNKAGP